MKPLNRPKIKKFFNDRVEAPNYELVFLLQSFDSPLNVGHMFRIADATGASKLYLTGKTPLPSDAKFMHDISITSMGQENRVEWEHAERVEDVVRKLKFEGYQIISLEITEKSVKYTNIKYGDKVCFVLGNETKGVFPSVLSLSDEVAYIPMFGKNHSLNVHVSAAVAAFSMIEQLSV